MGQKKNDMLLGLEIYTGSVKVGHSHRLLWASLIALLSEREKLSAIFFFDAFHWRVLVDRVHVACSVSL